MSGETPRAASSSTHYRLGSLADGMARIENKQDRLIDEIGSLGREISALRVVIQHVNDGLQEQKDSHRELEKRVSKLEAERAESKALSKGQSMSLAAGGGTIAGAIITAIARWFGWG